jgi:hypothetical protein
MADLVLARSERQATLDPFQNRVTAFCRADGCYEDRIVCKELNTEIGARCVHGVTVASEQIANGQAIRRVDPICIHAENLSTGWAIDCGTLSGREHRGPRTGRSAKNGSWEGRRETLWGRRRDS